MQPGQHARLTPDPDGADLHRDARGAILLMAVFLAVFLVGILYYALALGQTILRREALQDMADAAALSAAVTHARGMNLIALLNVVMAALLTILITIRLVQGLCYVGMAVAAAAAFPTWGASLAAIPPLKVVESKLQTAYETVEPPVHAALRILHTLSDYTVTATPAIARGVGKAGETAQTALVITPTRESLPVEDDSFDRLCSVAGGYAMTVYTKPLDPIPGFGYVAQALKAAAKAITHALADWFCGDSDGDAPSYEHTVDATYPPAVAERCGDSNAPEIGDSPAHDATHPACTDAADEARASTPDPVTGNCMPTLPSNDDWAEPVFGNDCGPDGPYETRIAAARMDCAPTSRPRPETYQYQIRSGTVAYRWSGDGWTRGTPEYSDPRRVPADPKHPAKRPPCGLPTAVYGVEYNRLVHPDGDPNTVLPVCSNEEPPSVAVPPRNARGGSVTLEPVTVRFTEVTQILGCTKAITRTQRFDGGPRMGAGGSAEGSDGDDSEQHDGNDKAPKRVVEGLQLGSESFQLRAIAISSDGRARVRDGVRLPLWGKATSPGAFDSLARHGRFAFAQAEFFYDGAGSKEEWMWNMGWRARLRVFRLEDDAAEPARESCGAQTSTEACDGAFDTIERLEEFLTH